MLLSCAGRGLNPLERKHCKGMVQAHVSCIRQGKTDLEIAVDPGVARPVAAWMDSLNAETEVFCAECRKVNERLWLHAQVREAEREERRRQKEADLAHAARQRALKLESEAKLKAAFPIVLLAPEPGDPILPALSAAGGEAAADVEDNPPIFLRIPRKRISGRRNLVGFDPGAFAVLVFR